MARPTGASEPVPADRFGATRGGVGRRRGSSRNRDERLVGVASDIATVGGSHPAVSFRLRKDLRGAWMRPVREADWDGELASVPRRCHNAATHGGNS